MSTAAEPGEEYFTVNPQEGVGSGTRKGGRGKARAVGGGQASICEDAQTEAQTTC